MDDFLSSNARVDADSEFTPSLIKCAMSFIHNEQPDLWSKWAAVMHEVGQIGEEEFRAKILPINIAVTLLIREGKFVATGSQEQRLRLVLQKICRQSRLT